MARPYTPTRVATAPSALNDSPFSDYVTDYSLSPEIFEGPGTLGTQKTLLGRINHLSSQVIRKEPSGQVASRVQAQLNLLEELLGAPEPQSRQPAELADSGLFIEEDDDDLESLGLSSDSGKAGVETVEEIVSKAPQGFVPQEQLDEIEAQLREVTAKLLAQLKHVKDINAVAELKVDSLTAENVSLRLDINSILAFRSTNQLLCDKVAELEADARENANIRAENSQLRENIGHLISQLNQVIRKEGTIRELTAERDMYHDQLRSFQSAANDVLALIEQRNDQMTDKKVALQIKNVFENETEKVDEDEESGWETEDEETEPSKSALSELWDSLINFTKMDLYDSDHD